MSLSLKSFSIKKHKLLYETLSNLKIQFSEINNQELQEDLIENKSFLSNSLLKLLNDKSDINLFNRKFSDFSYNHLKTKMKNNSQYKLNTINARTNTQLLINQINPQSGAVISTLNQLLNSLRNSNNLFLNNNNDENSIDRDFDFDINEDEINEEYENDENEEDVDEDEQEYDSGEDLM